MAEFTQIDAIDNDWTNQLNWNDGASGSPVSGDTVILTTWYGAFTTNLLGVGDTINVEIHCDASGNSLSQLVGTSVGVGTLTIGWGDSGVILDRAVTTQVVLNGASMAGAALRIAAATTVACPDIQLGIGTLSATGAAAVLDGVVTGFYGASGIDWGSGNLSIAGGLNANGQTITHSNTTGSTLTIDTAGTLNLGGSAAGLAIVATATGTVTNAAAVTCKTFTLATAGCTYVDGGYAHTIAGDIALTAGALTGTSTWTQTASGTISTGNYERVFRTLRLGWTAGATSTLAAETWCNNFASGAGIVAAGGLLTVGPNGDNFWTSGAGTWSGAIEIQLWLSSTARSCGAINIGSNAIRVVSGGNIGLTMTGAFTCGALRLTGGNNQVCTLSMGANSLTAGAVLLGTASQATRAGVLSLGSGIHTITSIAKAQSDATAANAVDFGSCRINGRNGGSINGGASTPIVFTNTGGKVVATTGVTFTIDYVTTPASGTKIKAYGCVDGTHNNAASVEFLLLSALNVGSPVDFSSMMVSSGPMEF
jgi:hypothetical protein